jgi:hypothetical protein
MKRLTKEDVEREIAALDSLGITALQNRWRDLYRVPPPFKIRSGFLRRAIAYRLQELLHGGLKNSTKKELRRIAEASRLNRSHSAGRRPKDDGSVAAAAVVAGLKECLLDRRRLLDLLGEVDAKAILAATTGAAQIAESLDIDPAVVSALVIHAVVRADRLSLVIDSGFLRRGFGRVQEEETASLTHAAKVDVPLTFRKRGRQLKLSVDPVASDAARAVDATLVTAVARAFDWFDRLASGRARSIDEVAAIDGFDAAYISHLIPLAHLAPAEIERIIAGSQSPELTADILVHDGQVSLAW